jgi:hypothetical protein
MLGRREKETIVLFMSESPCVCVWMTNQTHHLIFRGFMRQEKTVKPQNPKRDESGMGRDESGAPGTNRAQAGTNQRREPVVSGLKAGRAGG